MATKAHAVLGATLALPLLAAPMAAESTASNTPDRLTENQLDAVAAGGGHYPTECLCGVDTRKQEYWDHHWDYLRDQFEDRLPKWQLKPVDPPVVTTMALGEEGGGISPIFWSF